LVDLGEPLRYKKRRTMIWCGVFFARVALFAPAPFFSRRRTAVRLYEKKNGASAAIALAAALLKGQQKISYFSYFFLGVADNFLRLNKS
jgi:hypothetical protein